MGGSGPFRGSVEAGDDAIVHDGFPHAWGMTGIHLIGNVHREEGMVRPHRRADLPRDPEVLDTVVGSLRLRACRRWRIRDVR